MFGLFKNRNNTSELFKDGDWKLVQGEYAGNPIIVRVNNSLSKFVGKTDYILKIGFAIPLNSPNPGEMPNPDENDELACTEELIISVVKSHGAAVQALAITMGTFKEFVFYAEKDFDVQSAHEQLMKEIKSHEIQCMAQVEDDWVSYTNWANG